MYDLLGLTMYLYLKITFVIMLFINNDGVQFLFHSKIYFIDNN